MTQNFQNQETNSYLAISITQLEVIDNNKV